MGRALKLTQSSKSFTIKHPNNQTKTLKPKVNTFFFFRSKYTKSKVHTFSFQGSISSKKKLREEGGRRGKGEWERRETQRNRSTSHRWSLPFLSPPHSFLYSLLLIFHFSLPILSFIFLILKIKENLYFILRKHFFY